ncbi:protein tramtrack, alpha isoform-like isoform X1 [Thrips palmi]|uniref:Protein tramtrack, alpha isoform-like isoform X1 n=1 Tax=Thrips palmi TaxID=161013 RepID=A0A6P9ACM2_THRPL|nr:protein tramtrack, alpha isoform-like isoform X1 [Thrips palmi]XP_034255943.1 protein tramtrack, alpha isoform-like isoform X1 [Thrips palmi]XP_034255944.1 protein tramtrack, alpha isoform-like isoform X1 [Thrips palmi]
MSGTAMQQFRLRWNNHQPNFISVFTTLLNSESLVDVTLGAEGKHVQAHKVVLSACSSYFQSLFTLNPCQHPIVILKDVKYDDLKVIVDFMYYGEVNVSQEQLPAILKTAEMLKVKGLAEMPAQNNISMSKSRSLSSDKGDDIATPPGDSASGWGSDSVRHSPSPQPMSPAMRRKRLRKTSTGSGSGSTERTSEEQSVDINVVKAEPMSFQSEGESIRSSSSLRNSLQEASTESEPPDGSTESVEDPNIHSSHDSVSGPNVDNPGSSAIYNPTPGKLGSKRGRLLMRQSRVKNLRDPRDCESSVTIAQASPESDDGSPHLHGCVKLEQSSPDRMATNLPSSRGSSPGPLREVSVKRDGSKEKMTTVTVSSSGGQQLTVPGLRIERQSSDSKPISSTPSPQPPSQSMSLLSVPTTYLVKQHSHPNLPSHSSAPLVNVVQRQHSQPSRLPTQHLMSSLSFERMSIESDNPPSSATATASPSSSVGSAQLLRLVAEPPISLRRATSSPQSSSPLDLGQSLIIEPARSGHCPVQREGPALGCNFCWNTIDNHGRTLRRKTKYHCPECKTNLCIVPCFQEYHEQQSKKEAALGTSPSGNVSSSMIRLLPKTSSI